MKKTFEGISKSNWIAGIVLSFIVIGWFVYQQWWVVHLPPEQVRVSFDPKCDLRAGPCVTTLEDGSRISFAIEPRSIPVSEKLKLEVTVSSGLDVDGVSVDINGVDMKMPPNIVDLKETGNGRYMGKGALSFCTRSIMEWESVIQLDAGDKQINVPFRFITSQQGY
ncbi:MAG: hypothetical protein HOM14_18700 [Gammaproteobacteria bacterium]|jgi:hypothetical protein|nr:hypothetical protein [Gammaproteobacteria bacterium]MBT3724165.1 hypothetical protein [Gammaproteobacteria bacterium]MBT4194754.1 hypothetical protein [Gammaproteobacteria bacterium]MBT4450399.1 hypothetical protein [Gammaproteobacteria bacterium]MBT4861564.1 hypothetical protein [Gammaproteobacteria bacterium]